LKRVHDGQTSKMRNVTCQDGHKEALNHRYKKTFFYIFYSCHVFLRS